MKRITKLLLAAGFIATMAATSVHSQTNIFPNGLWTFDENGPGLFQGGGIVGYVNGIIKMDPVSGISTLYYNWGQLTVPGDVRLFEPGVAGTNNPVLSDVLRFDDLGGMYFFSEREPGELNPDRADVAQLPSPWPGLNNGVNVFEVGPEGNNGYLYHPLPGQPGFDTSGVFPNVSYNFISDVPEPSSAALMLFGAGILGLRFPRRKV